MDLSIASVSAYQQSRIADRAQVLVAAKTLNIAREQGAAALQLLQGATAGISAGDSQTAAATGLGGRIDGLA